MEATNRYYDYCIPYTDDRVLLRRILNELTALDYKTIALEQVFDYTNKNVKKKGNMDKFPAPVNIDDLKAEYDKKLKILQRLTIIYADADIAHAMTTSLNLKKFNVLAGQPKTDQALKHCCTAFNGDIITFGTEAGLRLLVGHKDYKIAVKRGIFFELKYALAIVDSNNLKDMIKLANNLAVKGKAQNVIFSSGAKHEFELRAPNDVANLAYIFGMSEDQGKNAIDRLGREVFLRAESRRLGKTIMFVKSSGPVVCPDSSDEEADLTDNDEKHDLQDMLELELELELERSDMPKNGNDNCANSSTDDETDCKLNKSKRLKIYE